MSGLVVLLVFCLDGQRYALRLEKVRGVLRAVRLTRLPGSPEVVLGVINVRGEVIPVVGLRRRLGLPEAGIQLTDRFIVTRTATRTVAIICDSTEGVIERSDEDLVPVRQILPGTRHVEGIARHPDGLILIQDLDHFLSLDEEQGLERALESAPEAAHDNAALT